MDFEGRKITVGITGGIAASEAAEIIGWLQAAGAKLQVVMSAAACQRIAPMAMEALFGCPVITDIMVPRNTVDHYQAPHFDQTDCELYLLLSATANILAKSARGITDDAVAASLLTNQAPVLCAKSLNNSIYDNPATQHNLQILKQRGWKIIEPASEHFSCLEAVKDRVADTETIKKAIAAFFTVSDNLAGKKVIVSAGPTYEYIDPVSFIGTRGSGKMGYALAAAAAQEGAEVVLVSGPVTLSEPAGVTVRHVVSALEMQAAIQEEYDDADIVIMAAAVADYCPAQIADHKLKKGVIAQQLDLVLAPDILAGLGQCKGGRFLVGFAAETDNLEQYAQRKLIEKNLDLVLANNVLQEGAGFDVDTNIITAIYGDNVQHFPQMSKKQAAKEIISLIVKLLG